MCCWDCTFQDISLSCGIQAGGNSIAQLCGDWDNVECGFGAGHRDAGDIHYAKVVEAMSPICSVVHLEGCYGLCNDLGHHITGRVLMGLVFTLVVVHIVSKKSDKYVKSLLPGDW